MAAIIVTTIQLAFQFPYFIELYEKNYHSYKRYGIVKKINV